jgi:hypothetical protein
MRLNLTCVCSCCEKRRSAAALQNASDKFKLLITATLWSAALLRRFGSVTAVHAIP